jgi:hypothetical protein
MRPEGNEAGKSFLNPPALDSWRGGFFVLSLPPVARRSFDPRSGLQRPREGLEV